MWPWLVRVGCLRAGWNADDLLDDLAHPSARQIIPKLQNLEAGAWPPMTPTPLATTTFVIDSPASRADGWWGLQVPSVKTEPLSPTAT